jgi:hypothetical protein
MVWRTGFMPKINYPANVENSKTPFVVFSIYDTRRGNPQSSNNDVVLFMPPAFQITDGQEYEFAEKGSVGQFAGLFEGGAGEYGETGILAKALSMVGLKSDAAQGLAEIGAAARDPKFFNYKEPRPREFTFNYKFDPKNEADAQAMLYAIDILRVASYPTTLGGGLAYQVPSSVKIKFTNFNPGLGSQTLPNFWVIKELNTTLSEGDQVITFPDGIPTQVSLQIQFMETVLLSKSGSKLVGDSST